MYVNFLSTYSDKKSFHTSINNFTNQHRAVCQRLSAIAELLFYFAVIFMIFMELANVHQSDNVFYLRGQSWTVIN